MRGLIQVYTGNGKGKTTAALGLALRALGQGFKVYFIQFLKPGSFPSGEIQAANKWLACLKIVRLADDSFLGPVSDELRFKTRSLYQTALDNVVRQIYRDNYQMVVLDEALNALHLGLMEWDWLEEVIRHKPPGLELVLTGNPLPDKLRDAADLVSEVRMIKHPYSTGIPARPGIEY